MPKTYFLLLDPQKNTVKVDSEFAMQCIKHRAISDEEIIKHSTQAELFDEIRSYIKGGYRSEK